MKTKKAQSKKRTAAGRKPRRLPPVTGSQSRYAFVNNKGKLMWIDGKTTIPELLKMGVRNITLEPIGSPMPIDPKVFVHTPSSENEAAEQPPACGGSAPATGSGASAPVPVAGLQQPRSGA